MVVSDRIRRLAANNNGWIGVDLDGTMFTYHKWVGWNVFGEPIMPMIERIVAWHDANIPVRIVTARVGLPIHIGRNGALTYRIERVGRCYVTNERFSDTDMVAAIHEHCLKHGVPALPVQCFKDSQMIELWDDRAVQVVANTGARLTEHCATLVRSCGECDCPEMSRRAIIEADVREEH